MKKFSDYVVNENTARDFANFWGVYNRQKDLFVELVVLRTKRLGDKNVDSTWKEVMNSIKEFEDALKEYIYKH